MTHPDAPARSVQLSDGSVWTLEISRVSGQWWHRIGDVMQLRLPQMAGRLPLTAADHRKIAAVLDPQPSSDGLASLKAKIEALRDDVIEDMEYPDLILRPEHEGQLAALDAVLALLESPSSPEP